MKEGMYIVSSLRLLCLVIGVIIASQMGTGFVEIGILTMFFQWVGTSGLGPILVLVGLVLKALAKTRGK